MRAILLSRVKRDAMGGRSDMAGLVDVLDVFAGMREEEEAVTRP